MDFRAPVDDDLAILLADAADHVTTTADSSVDELRAEWRATSAWMRGPTDPTLASVPMRDDRIGDVPVRWYGPDLTPGTDVVLYFHGGGWMLGEAAAYDPDLRLLARTMGCTVAAVDYRRTPEHVFPAAVDDCLSVIANVAALAPGRIALAGDSAGGNLALGSAVALSGSNTIDAVLALYPVIDPHALDNASYRENGAGYLLTSEAMALYWDRYASTSAASEDPRANLTLAELSGFPPSIIVSADYDPLRDEARDFARRLVEADVEVTYLPTPGLTHGFQQMVPRIPAATRALERSYEALASVLRRTTRRSVSETVVGG